jgi:UDP-N-acetyl-D-mannosaminuronic acid dehydrogenase
MPILVAGVDEPSTTRAKELLGIVCKAEVIPASSIKVVETAKVFENVQRDVNIAMVQEFARFTEALGIDIFEVVNLANTHKRVKLLAPGPGVGGYCLPNAYYYLKPKAEQMGISLSLLELARKENDAVPQIIVDMLERALADNGKHLNGADIAVLGLAMKDYSNDARISPPLEIVNILLQKQANVKAFDPAVDGDYPYKVDDINKCISDVDAVMILAKQHEIDSSINKVLSEVPEGAVVLDTRDIRSFAEPALLSRVRYVCI